MLFFHMRVCRSPVSFPTHIYVIHTIVFSIIFLSRQNYQRIYATCKKFKSNLSLFPLIPDFLLKKKKELNFRNHYCCLIRFTLVSLDLCENRLSFLPTNIGKLSVRTKYVHVHPCVPMYVFFRIPNSGETRKKWIQRVLYLMSLISDSLIFIHLGTAIASPWFASKFSHESSHVNVESSIPHGKINIHFKI